MTAALSGSFPQGLEATEHEATPEQMWLARTQPVCILRCVLRQERCRFARGKKTFFLESCACVCVIVCAPPLDTRSSVSPSLSCSTTNCYC